MADSRSRQSEEDEAEPTPSPATLDFRTIFELEVAYVMRVLRRLGIAEADVEDMAHEVFLAVNSKLHTYDRSRPLRPWLFGFAFRVASRHRRKARRERLITEPDALEASSDAPDAQLAIERKRELVLRALEHVEVERRAVFIMHDIDGVTCEEVARSLEIPIGTVYSRLRLARKDFEAAVRRLVARGGKR